MTLWKGAKCLNEIFDIDLYIHLPMRDLVLRNILLNLCIIINFFIENHVYETYNLRIGIPKIFMHENLLVAFLNMLSITIVLYCF